jgi:hypothetical protein
MALVTRLVPSDLIALSTRTGPGRGGAVGQRQQRACGERGTTADQQTRWSRAD